jgi:hypothetical protein
MMALVEKYDLRDSVVIKGEYTNTQIYQAQAAGYPIFSYFGTAEDVNRKAIEELGGQLHPERDYLVLAGMSSDPASPYISDDLIKAAVATGIPVWVHPLHRRSAAAHFFALGAQGAVCASYGYIAGTTRPVATDAWAAQKIAPGEVTRSAGSQSYAPSFTTDGQLVLAAKGVPHFLTLGQFCPVPAAAGSYVIDVDACWLGMPGSDSDNLTVAFGHQDDQYYEDQLGIGTGYHVILKQNGEFGLYLHHDGSAEATQLTKPVSTPALDVGGWVHLRVEVTPDRITASRTDTATAVTAADSTVRGGYLHIGRASTKGSAAFRGFTIS